ncbi:TPA: EAL domain-containing protein [Vibrio vulnificus]|uniref:PTS sugar transporter subunit IIC/EAL domain-containing protein n=1 Tax=Vibrio vulnificus TaxID=672 RepID=UPI001023D3CF|nr:EAL domain-containing protein [Vibrio vulnificus]EJT0552768.1 PTS sugar transporter subunit IIC/EAL domain-containing protein [Vibrio vulnificus]EKY4880725.1 PTS sugar transporter subunit IIC/EAL domain-containing protein [Vibrio vulnificus]ELY1391666.1 PTS sugar transporter subunit IIC/EAL domain-containing protein [Vibrio vulnificus]MBN8083942.1 PTS sugar transporter subunit IIC/EAL domain-containing protein [Vibrio vulnificus]MBN8126816.1 PTS sugar transporter subunit IIC/EAL domain-cont
MEKQASLSWTVVGINLKKVSKRLAPSLQAIREGMIWLIPCLMLSAFALFFASMGEFVGGGRSGWINALYDVHNAIASFFPYLMTATISYVLAMQWKLARPPMALLSIIFLLIVGHVVPADDTLKMFHIVIAIVTPLYAIPILAHLLHVPQLRITNSDSGGKLVKESLNLVLPALLTAFIVVVINYLIFSMISFGDGLKLVQLDYANEPYEFGIAFAAMNSLLWFLGVHGYYALLPLVELLQQASSLNYSTFVAGGEGHYAMNLSMMGTFVFIGGSGATLSLVVAMLLFAKQKSLKLIAIASIPIGLINVNEILLFGLPIILNPRMFLPFFLTPAVHVVTTLLAIEIGVIDVPSASVPFNAPIIINAWLATSGDWGGVLLQLFNIAVGVVIYYPSVRNLNRLYSNREIKIDFLDTVYVRRREEADTLKDDPIATANDRARRAQEVEQRLEHIGSKEFCLEYQPQVSHQTGRVVGCEALIRAIEPDGTLVYPGTFLPWLEEAGLMKDVDLWVLKTVAKDIQEWNRIGLYVPVSINLTPAFLADQECMDKLEYILAPVASQVHIEITEETLLVDEQVLARSFNLLHQLGVAVYIDDFGTGFSSLSYLNRFEVDAIKVDRSFVLALDNEKGKKVFMSLLSVAEQLGLEVVIEGVESQQQLNHIPAKEHISIQGWYYSRSLQHNSFIQYCINANRLTPVVEVD